MKPGIQALVAVILTSGLFAANLSAQMDRDAGARKGGKQVQLDIESEGPGGRFTGCLRPALRAAGVDWTTEYLKGYLGQAFTFAMKEDGSRLNHDDSYDWHHIFEMLEVLDYDVTNVSLREGNSNYATPEGHDKAKADAWEKIRRGIDDGYPAVAWQVMSVETKASGQRPLPGMWSLIVGYDEAAETYTVHHARCGTFTIRWDAFGHTDPVNWFCVMIFRPQEPAHDASAASRRAIERAIESSRGMHQGTHAPAHGLAAWEMWHAAFEDGRVSIPDVSNHADFLIASRHAAATYVRQIEPHFPESAGSALREASGRYDQVVDEISELRDLCAKEEPDLKRGARILSAALEAERAALGSLQQVLDAR